MNAVKIFFFFLYIFLSYTGLFGIFNIIPNLLLKDNKINRIKKESLLFNIIISRRKKNVIKLRVR